MKKEISLIPIEFANDFFGNLDIISKRKIVVSILNPCEETWNDVFNLVIKVDDDKVVTIWQAVINIDPRMIKKKNKNSIWGYTPSGKTILKAIKETTLSLNKFRLN